MIEHSQQYLLHAQMNYFREMIAINSNRLSERALGEMHEHLKQAMRELNMRRDNRNPTQSIQGI